MSDLTQTSTFAQTTTQTLVQTLAQTLTPPTQTPAQTLTQNDWPSFLRVAGLKHPEDDAVFEAFKKARTTPIQLAAATPENLKSTLNGYGIHPGEIRTLIEDALKKFLAPPPGIHDFDSDKFGPFWGKIYQDVYLDVRAQYLCPSFAGSVNAYLSTVSLSDITLTYKTPQELLVNKELAPLVVGKLDCIVPVLQEGTKQKVDFRFLQDDLIKQTDTIEIVDQVLAHIKADNHSTSVLVGPSGSVKTRALFDIARATWSLYFECSELSATIGSLDMWWMVKQLNKFPLDKHDTAMPDMSNFICIMIFSRLYFLMHRCSTGTPEQWLLLQLPNWENQHQLTAFFHYCVWLTFKFPSAINEMHYFLQQSPTVVMCFDETNNLLESLEGHFQTQSGQSTSFAHPFLYSVLSEFRNPIVLAGTRLCLRQLESALSPITAKFTSVDRNRSRWKVFRDIEYIESPAVAERILACFLSLSPAVITQIAPDIIGRARFLFGFLLEIFSIIVGDEKTSAGCELSVVSKFETYKTAVIKLLNVTISDIYDQKKYNIVFLEEVQNMPTEVLDLNNLLQHLVFGSIFRSEFFYSYSSKAYDLISLGVCLLKKSMKDENIWSIGEPWAIEALLQFFEGHNIDIQRDIVREQALHALEINGAKDAGKGKILEWLSVLQLKSLCGQSPFSIPIFAAAKGKPNVPAWFTELTNIKFTKIQRDCDGDLLIGLVRNIDETVIAFPPNEARTDGFGIVRPTCFLIGAKFYSKRDVAQVLANETSTNPDNIFCKSDGTHYEEGSVWENRRKAFKRAITASRKDTDSSFYPLDKGVVRILITLPTMNEGQSPITFKNENGRVDAVLRIDEKNLDQFFDKIDVQVLNLFQK